MKLTKRLRQYLRLQSASFTVLFLAVLAVAAWASTKYTAQADWTYGNRNTLSQPSRELLQQLDGKVTFQAFASDSEQLRDQIRNVARRYTRASETVELTFVNPKTNPQKVRDLGIQRQGTIVVRYQGRTAKVSQYEEAKLTNAIKRVADASETKLAFLTGHGERAINGRARSDLTVFKRALENQGYATRSLSLAQVRQVPKDVSVLVVADPRQKLLPQERERIRDYVANGGNLLWLADVGGRAPPQLGGKTQVVDAGAATIASPVQVFGARSRAFGVVTDYSGTQITRDFSKTTVFPKARNVQIASSAGWTTSAFLQTGARSWADTGAFDQSFDQGEDRRGPVTLGVTLTRQAPQPSDSSAKTAATSSGSGQGVVKAAASASGGQSGTQAPGSAQNGKSQPTGQQRIVVIGDADFMSNAFIGFGGNRDLAMNTVKWLSGDTASLNISTPQPPGQNLNLSVSTLWALQALFMGLLPIGLLAAGGATWVRQRRR
ncbi:hypothetical protein CKO28_03415 [Rhodovibrio sodomensis]|uniref:ABC transporter n=1 Tax=Rhodovibrio sodomensis TaxID=1088 RepID=A0ABS1DA43_9PROT|nr:DUF4350 domain-containing protein [Rhodovibrio sodomensis]MBK1667094.1 hypothetical protein [Rhodovibrio sodomensis]